MNLEKTKKLAGMLSKSIKAKEYNKAVMLLEKLCKTRPRSERIFLRSAWMQRIRLNQYIGEVGNAIKEAKRKGRGKQFKENKPLTVYSNALNKLTAHYLLSDFNGLAKAKKELSKNAGKARLALKEGKNLKQWKNWQKLFKAITAITVAP